jgi:general secretion pathway protein G
VPFETPRYNVSGLLRDTENENRVPGERVPTLASGRASRRTRAGFTILELLAVVFIISLIAAIAIPRYQRAILKAREAALKQNLHVMRSVIDQYFADKKKYPESLEELVRAGYLRSVPVDPFTESSGTWRTIPAESSPFGPPEESGGVFDVKSGASGIGTNNISYGEW